MAIGLICRHCGARLKVPEKAAGKLGKCPKCKEVIRVPKAVSPEAHFCDRCQKNLGEESDLHLVTGKTYCAECYEKIQGDKRKTGDSVLDQLDINIPGMVVLRGKDQRQMGRMLQDVSAKKEFKEKAHEEPKPEEPAEPEEEEEPAPEPAPEEPQPEAAEAPATEQAREEEAAGSPPAEATPLLKGQRPADALLTKLLVEQGVVLDGELELALQYQRGLGKRLIPVLDDLKLTSEKDITRAVSESTGLELCPEGELEIAEHVWDLLDDEILSRYEVVPVTREGDALVVAFPNPLDAAAVKELRDILGTRIIPKICTWTQYAEGRRFLMKAKSSA